MDECCEKGIKITAVAKCPKMRKGEKGEKGERGPKGDKGDRGDPGDLATVRLLDHQYYLVKSFSKNAASADPDRVWSNIYSPPGTFQVKTWSMNPSYVTPPDRLILTTPISPFFIPGTDLLIKVHILVMQNNQTAPQSGWAKIRILRDETPPAPLVAYPANKIGTFEQVVDSDELFIQEPADDLGPPMMSSVHYIFTLRVPAFVGFPLYSRYFISVERTATTNQPEFPNELQFEFMEIYYERYLITPLP